MEYVIFDKEASFLPKGLKAGLYSYILLTYMYKLQWLFKILTVNFIVVSVIWYPGYQRQYSLKSEHSYHNKLRSVRPNTTDSKPKAASRASGTQSSNLKGFFQYRTVSIVLYCIVLCCVVLCCVVLCCVVLCCVVLCCVVLCCVVLCCVVLCCVVLCCVVLCCDVM